MAITRVSQFILKVPGAGTTGQVLTRDTTLDEGMKWDAVPTELPSQTGNSGKVLTTNGTAVSWGNEIPSQTGNSGKVLTTNGTAVSWGNEIPTQTGNSGKFLTTNGTAVSWDVPGTTNIPAGFQCVLRRTGSTTCALFPFRGNSVMIANTPRAITTSGVTYTISGSPSNGLYYVLASWSGSAVTLSIARTSSTTIEKTTYGYYVNNANTAQTVVGAAYIHSNNFAWPGMTFTVSDTDTVTTLDAFSTIAFFNAYTVSSLYNNLYAFPTYGPDYGTTDFNGFTVNNSTPFIQLVAAIPVIAFEGQLVSARSSVSCNYTGGGSPWGWSITGTGKLTMSNRLYMLADTDLSSGALTVSGSNIAFDVGGQTNAPIFTSATPMNTYQSKEFWTPIPGTINATTVGARVFLGTTALKAEFNSVTFGSNMLVDCILKVS